jgi:hypothetical protein
VEDAERMNMLFRRLNAIVKGRRDVNAGTALLLERLPLGTGDPLAALR